MYLDDLKPLYKDEELDSGINKEQLDVFLGKYIYDFVENPFTLGGKNIKLITKKSNIEGFKDYSETFTHIITRKLQSYSTRIYDAERANRIHWIKPILQLYPCRDILYFIWVDSKGVCKEHYWAIHKGFMVVLKTISIDLQIVTAFCVDNDAKDTYYERYKIFKDGKCESK